MSGSEDAPQFTSPGNETNTPGQAGGEGVFAVPTAAQLGAESDDQEAQSLAAELPQDLIALKAEIESKLSTSAAAAAEVGVQSVEGGNINGVGFAVADADDLKAGLAANVAPGQLALAVFTVERQEPTRLQAEIASVAGTRTLSTLPVAQVPVGIVEAQPHRFRIRPAPGGVSLGHVAITAGTLGCLSVGLNPPRKRRSSPVP